MNDKRKTFSCIVSNHLWRALKFLVSSCLVVACVRTSWNLPDIYLKNIGKIKLRKIRNFCLEVFKNLEIFTGKRYMYFSVNFFWFLKTGIFHSFISLYLYIRCSKQFQKIDREIVLRRSLFFNEVHGLKPAALLKKEALAHVYFCKFCKIFKSTYSGEHLQTTASENW